MRYRKKQIMVDAVRYKHGAFDEMCGWVKNALDDGTIGIDEYLKPYINTLEGVMIVSDGDYIIRGIDGEIYPCKPDIFDKTYEPVMTDEIELKTCPFCLKKPKLDDRTHQVGCINGLCNVLPQTWSCDTDEEAISMWNDRGEKG